MIVVRAVENGFVIHGEHPEMSRYSDIKTWVAPTIDELQDVVAMLAAKEREHKKETK